MRTRQWLVRAGLAALALGLGTGAKNGCGSKEANDTFTSPVQAVTTVLEHDDGSVEANTVLISTRTTTHDFVDTATNVQLRLPDGTPVPLSLDTPGHYVAEPSALSFTAGGTYQIKFDLDDASAAGKVAGGNFVAVMDAPDDTVTASFSTPPAFTGDTSTIKWSPSNRYGLIRISDASGNIVYENFDFNEPHFDGSKWARLTKGGSVELGVDVFADAGTYTVRVCAVDKVSDFDKSLSADLGTLSGFLMGRCAPEFTVDVAN